MRRLHRIASWRVLLDFERLAIDGHMRDEKGNDYENSLTIIDNKIKQKNEGIFK